MNQVLAIGILQREGYTVTVANNGVEAVEAFAAEPFDLILMDLQMPDMDGLQATAAIRQIESNRGGHIPILAMTAHALTGDRERCLAAGMDGYLAKPIRLKDLVRAIPEVCESARQ
jgi:CheY-like chemotaxis protein